VVFYFQTATDAGKLSAHNALTSQAALDQQGFFVNDTWSFGRATLNAGFRYDRYHGWLPEQEQLAGSLSAWASQLPSLSSRVIAKTFPESHLYTWNVAAPRIGLTFDLTGDGKTVLKGNYGLYWHNPGVGVASDANPNTPGKSATYTWTDTNRDQRWQPGEESALPTSASLEGSLRLDPNIKAPYTHEASAWIERQLTDTMGARAGFVYKTEDDIIRTLQPGRPLSAYTVPFNFTDIGVDGRAGTSDDKVIPMLGFPNAQAANFPTDQVVMNAPQYGRYKTFEVSMNKRYGNKWSGSAGFGYTMQTNFPENYPLNPNQPGVQDRSLWNFKASGSYDAKGGIRISPVLRHQSGVNFARTVAIATPTGSGLTATGTGYAELADANREDNIWVFDVRAERTFNFGSRVRLRGYFDAFNLTNSHASETISRATGLGYLKPSAILAPRTARVGFRFIF
jgi:hypothetical protein